MHPDVGTATGGAAYVLPLLAAAWLWGAFRIAWGEPLTTLPPMLIGAALFVYAGRYARREF